MLSLDCSFKKLMFSNIYLLISVGRGYNERISHPSGDNCVGGRPICFNFHLRLSHLGLEILLVWSDGQLPPSFDGEVDKLLLVIRVTRHQAASFTVKDEILLTAWGGIPKSSLQLSSLYCGSKLNLLIKHSETSHTYFQVWGSCSVARPRFPFVFPWSFVTNFYRFLISIAFKELFFSRLTGPDIFLSNMVLYLVSLLWFHL